MDNRQNEKGKPKVSGFDVDAINGFPFSFLFAAGEFFVVEEMGKNTRSWSPRRSEKIYALYNTHIMIHV